MEFIVFESGAYYKLQQEMVDLVIKTVSQKLPENGMLTAAQLTSG
jgi:hypothetical protein